MRFITWYFVLLLMCLWSCKQDSKFAGLKVFNYNQASGVSSIDPAFAGLQSNIWVVNQLYNGLLETDSNLNIVPSLAKWFEIKEQGLLYVFHLRNDVFFHHDSCFENSKGRKFTAQDVVYSFTRLIDPKVAAKGAWVFNDKVDLIKPFTAVNDSTFELRLRKPFPALPGILTMQYCFIVPHEAVEKYGKDFRSHPVGTGPFKFSFWREGELMVLKKNEHYFEKDVQGNSLPYLDAVRITFMDNKATEFLKFKLGELDMIVDLDAGVKDEVLTKTGKLQERYADKFRLIKKPYLNTEYIGINLKLAEDKKHPLNDERVRRAINLAINKKEIITYLRNGVGIPAIYGFVAPGISGYRQELLSPTPYQPEQALQLLKAAGYDDTNPLPELTISCNSANEALCVFIANQLKQIGISMKVDVMQGKALNEQMVKGSILMFKASWIADYPDAESFLAVCYGRYIAPPNYTRFNNSTYNKLYEISMMQSDDVVRNNTYLKMDELLMLQQALIPIYYDETLDFVHNNIKGFNPNPLNLLSLKYINKVNNQ
jgi:peptide/nickel transport system substrate-binding protein